MTEYYLWLLQFMGAANYRTHLLLKYFGTPEDVYNQLSSQSEIKLRFNAGELSRLKQASLEKSQRIINYCEKHNFTIITLDSEDYPKLLKNIYNPPIVLFVQGDISVINESVCIAGVGSRNATDYTSRVVKRICKPIAANGGVWVSGLAVGVDKLIHDAALLAGGKTVGIMACGCGVDYPKNSSAFRKEIVDCGGVCITELLPGAEVEPSYFKDRNRIISGISVGTVVFQAGEKSGALLTAKHAEQQGRTLFCIPPHDILDKHTYGGVMPLLRDGCVPVFSPESIVEELKFSYYDAAMGLINSFEVSQEEIEKEISKNKNVAVTKNVDEAAKKDEVIEEKNVDLSELTEQELKIYQYLADGKKNIDQITIDCNFDVAELTEYLLNLEMSGLIECNAGGFYSQI